jgi:hypothetical protein
MQADLAREIIAQALEDETYEGDVPDDDDKAVEVADGLVVMAKDAWEQNIQGPEVEAILKLAERDEDNNGAKPKAKAKPAAKRPAKKAEEPEPDPEPEPDSRASEEPWEDYDKDPVKDIIEGLDVWAEDEEFDSVQHILVYELANKNRKKIVERANEVLPDEMQIVEGSVEPEPEADPEPEPEATATEPYEGYDDSKVSEIKDSLNEYLDDEDTDDEDKLATLKQTFAYESLNKGRTGLMDYLDEKMDLYKEQEGDGDETGAPEEEGEAEGAAASSDDSGDEEGAEGGEGDSKKPGPAAGKRSRSGSAAKDGADSPPEGDDPEHTELLETVHELIARERLHVPAQIEDDPVELPFDLTTVGDKELQQLYSAFNAYSYRAGYLLMIEEAAEHKCKEAADEIVEAYIAKSDLEDSTVTKVKAEAEQHDQVKKWRKRQRRHGILATSLRKDRDNYDRVCERLSRIETMRQDEWQRAGGGPTAKSRPGVKK